MKNIVIGRSEVARKFKVSINLVYWLEKKGIIKPKREKLAGYTMPVYGKSEQEEIYKWKTRAD